MKKPEVYRGIYVALIAMAIGCGDDGGAAEGGDTTGEAATGTTPTQTTTDPTTTDPTTDPDTGTETGSGGDMVDFVVTIDNITATPAFTTSGMFNTPVGAAGPAPLLPGESYEISFLAAPGYPARPGTTRMSFASMFVPSNDLFFAPGAEGIRLFEEDGTPRSGSVTDEIMVWDAGTEADEPLNGDMATSPNQKPNQTAEAEDIGDDDPMDMVRLADMTYPGEIPAIDALISATLTSATVDGATQFTLTITNESAAGTLPGDGPTGGAVPLSPGVFAVYTYEEGDEGPLFTVGAADRDEGIEDIAEDGFPMRSVASATEQTGLRTVSSPGAWAVHSSDVSFFTAGSPLEDTGLEAIAEDGTPATFVATLEGLEGVVSAGQVGEMPLPPGMTYTIEFSASPGDVFSVATMFVPSNDLLFATPSSGIELFDADGRPRSGDFTADVGIWDAATEVNQAPGVGLDQVHLQSGADVGEADEDDTVRLVDDGFTYPAVTDSLTYTITPAE